MRQALRIIEDMLSGRDIMNLVEHEITDGMVFQPDDCDVACGNFSIGSHQSDIDPSNMHTLVLSTQARGRLHSDIDGVKQSTDIRSGTLTFVPAGLRQVYDYEGTTTNTVIGINDALFKRVTDIDPRLDDPGVLETRLGFVRPGLHALIEEQYNVMASDKAGSKVLTESIALKLAVELLAVFGKSIENGVAIPLNGLEINKLVDFIDAQMEDGFDLSDLAAVLERDPFAFSRSFKSATGSSPHQFVIQRRLMRVKDLLINTHETLADITYATGFSNQAHMTTTFAKHVGISPGRWRKAVKS